MTIDEFFDGHIFYINLDRRADRRRECEAELVKHGITAERFSAFDGQRFKKVSPLTMAEVGCCMSHHALLKMQVDNGWQRMLVLEDDVVFSDNTQELFFDMIKDVPDGWDMLYFGGNHELVPDHVAGDVYRCRRTYTTSSYAISLAAARAVIRNMSSNLMQADVVFSMNTQKRGNCYVVMPAIAWQRPSFSDIQNGFRDYTAFLKNRTEIALDRMETTRHPHLAYKGNNIRRIDAAVPTSVSFPHPTEPLYFQHHAINMIDYGALRDMCTVGVDDGEVDINIIIPVKGRTENASALVKHFEDAMADRSETYQLTFVEYSTSQEYDELAKTLRADYIHMPFDGIFNKCLAMNAGFLWGRKAKRYLFHDVDILVQSDFFDKLNENLGPEARQCFRKKRVLYCDAALSDRLRDGNMSADDLDIKSDGVREPEPHAHRAPGGSILVTREHFISAGGYDAELFFGYSCEDQMFHDKLEMTGTVESCDDIEVFHLFHPTRSDSNPFLQEQEALHREFMKNSDDKRRRFMASEIKNMQCR